MANTFDTRKSCVPFDQSSTLAAVIELSRDSWLVGGIVPGLERNPVKKLSANGKREDELLALLLRWRDEAIKSRQQIKRIAVAFESGRDGFWLARWLRVRGIEAYVIHAASTAVSREHRRAKTDRLDVELLKRGFLGWLRGEAGHCKMAAIPTPEGEDARRPGRERETLMSECTRIVNGMKADLTRLGVHNFNPKLRKASENSVRCARPKAAPSRPIPPPSCGAAWRGCTRSKSRLSKSRRNAWSRSRDHLKRRRMR
jgi:transposase